MNHASSCGVARRAIAVGFVVGFVLTLTAVAGAAAALDSARIDAVVTRALGNSGAPSASVAIVHDGAIAFTKAYGQARLGPPTARTSADVPSRTVAPTAATPSMRYPIGSISKQFTAAALVLLAREGKLDLDDPVAKFFPRVTRGDEITIRRLLSHTSGIRDYWPQDYVPPAMLRPIAPADLIARWATTPLDFDPGMQYQYSNTGYVIAGAIVEQVAGKPLAAFLRERIFEPLGMTSVVDLDGGALGEGDPVGYRRFALGPLRPVPKEGAGWLFAAGSLAMTAEDLARWDAAWITGGAPGPDVFDALGREVLLATGVGAGYGLGVGVRLDGARRIVRHGGEISGFTAANVVYPEERAAVVVLVNQDAVHVAGTIAARIADLLFEEDARDDDAVRARVRAILEGLRKGAIDRARFTDNGNAYSSEEALADVAASLRGLGRLKSLEQTSRSLRGGLTTRRYHAVYKKRDVTVVTRAREDGRLEQLTISAE